MPIPFPTPGANAIREISQLPNMIFEKNVDIPLKDGGLCRGNVWRPKGEGRWPVIMTYGPYGKDFPYKEFHVPSFNEIPEEQKSEYSAWETPHPDFWTSNGYVVLRVDERGIGSSPGFLDTMSNQTSSDFAECIEWAAEQSWSSGKVGLLGISYFGGSQWRVAARRPKGLACIIPWEGMTDYYRDRCRQGGIYSNNFIKTWWKNQVQPMQYGNPAKASRTWGPWAPIIGKSMGPECIEGELTAEELEAGCNDQTVDNRNNHFLDEEYYHSRTYKLSDIEVPTLSVANLGGNTLHLRGNVVGYLETGTKFKWLWFVSGRHDLPFYLPHYVELQKSFLDAWLKDEDSRGWKKGPNVDIPAVNLLVRKGNPGFNKTEYEATFKSRPETSWPLERTEYRKLYLQSSPSPVMTEERPSEDSTIKIEALGKGAPIQFKYTFDKETELAGHPQANLVMSVEKREDGSAPKDLDLFLTLRHLDAKGKEIFYTGTAGDPVPLCKGWLRASLRKVDESNPRHRDWLPHRNYESKDVSLLEPDTLYDCLVEIWPTACVVEAGNTIVLEVATGDTQGCGIFLHNDPTDRNEETFAGNNVINLGPKRDNWLKLPIV